jgi:hypothetical protein
MENKSIAYFRNIDYDAWTVDPGTDAQLFRPRAALEPSFSGWKGACGKARNETAIKSLKTNDPAKSLIRRS